MPVRVSARFAPLLSRRADRWAGTTGANVAKTDRAHHIVLVESFDGAMLPRPEGPHQERLTPTMPLRAFMRARETQALQASESVPAAGIQQVERTRQNGCRSAMTDLGEGTKAFS